MQGMVHSGGSTLFPSLCELRGVFFALRSGVLGVVRADAGALEAALRGVWGSREVVAGNALSRYLYCFLFTRGEHGGCGVMEGRLRRFFSLQFVSTHDATQRIWTYLSQARCAHAYGRAISSSDLSEWATLRERESRDTARSRSSGGRGPFQVGTRTASACSTVALLMFQFG